MILFEESKDESRIMRHYMSKTLRNNFDSIRFICNTKNIPDFVSKNIILSNLDNEGKNFIIKSGANPKMIALHLFDEDYDLLSTTGYFKNIPIQISADLLTNMFYITVLPKDANKIAKIEKEIEKLLKKDKNAS